MFPSEGFGTDFEMHGTSNQADAGIVSVPNSTNFSYIHSCRYTRDTPMTTRSDDGLLSARSMLEVWCSHGVRKLRSEGRNTSDERSGVAAEA